ncbi:MAG: hypothetical protein PHU25_04060 [Deltaproteobacteria bacterium]|nr:hypothetical protein [Deltaproteobacteria bacterium]
MNDQHNSSSRHVGIGISLVSASMLMTEIVLTRLFSVMIGFHFAFLAISVALFGIGTAALVLHLVQHRLPEERTCALLARGSVVLGAVIVLADAALVLVTPGWEGGATGVVNQITSIGYLLFTFCAASSPFLAGGFVVTLAVTRYAPRIHTLYFFDLLGAGLGCLLVIPALSLLGAPLALVLVAAVAAAAGIAFSRAGASVPGRALAWAPATAMAAFVALAALNPLTGLFEVRRAKGRDLERIPVEFNKWNSFSMVTVIGEAPGTKRFPGWGMSPLYAGEFPDQKRLFIDMGAMTPLTRFDGNLKSVGHLLWDLSAFAYRVRPGETKEVCVLGAGGGRDVLSALASGARHVTGVEINPIIVDDVVKRAFKGFVGGIYDRPDVTALVDDGRGYIRSTRKAFDLIQISMIDTSAATAAGAYSLTESSLYTIEAFGDDLAHLAPGGILTVSAVSAPIVDSGARLAAMAWHALTKRGASPAQSVAVISTRWLGHKNQIMHNVMVKNGRFTPEEIGRVRKGAADLAFRETYVPGHVAGPDNLIEHILTARDAGELDRRIRDLYLDVSASTDDRPFFFYQNRLDDALPVLGLGEARHPKGVMGAGLPVLLRVAVIALGMVILFLLVPIALGRAQLRAGRGRPGWDLSYVACLGLGFMYVEIGLIQSFTLYLGFPTATLAVVLLVLLGGGAAGSRLFGRVEAGKRRRGLAAAMGGLVVLLVGLWQTGLAHGLLDATTGWPLAGRAALTALLLAPCGLLLGMPLPTGLHAVSGRAAPRIPWLWAVNSATSVLGSVSATLFSMHAGISGTLWVGVALYALALLVSLRVTAPAEG